VAVKYRKEDGQTLSRETFDQALKRLVSDGFVIREDVDGRSKKYSLNPEDDKEKTKQLFFDFTKNLKEKIDWFDKILLKFDVKKAQSSTQISIQYEIIFTHIFLLCLEYQKRLFFLIHMPIQNKSLKKVIDKEQRRIAKILTTLPNSLPSIGPNSFEVVASAVKSIILVDITKKENELENSVKRFLGKI